MLPKIEKLSPNYSIVPNREIKLIVLHNTEGPMPGCLATLISAQAKVSAHYLVDRLGKIYQLVKDENVAWHALNTNQYSLGIEIEAWTTKRYKKVNGKFVLMDSKDISIPDYTLQASGPMTTEQEENVIALVKELKQKYPKAIIDIHRRVNVGKTICPKAIWPTNEDFDAWKKEKLDA